MIKVVLVDNGNNIGLLIDKKLVTIFRNNDIESAEQWVRQNISNTSVTTTKGDYRKLY